MQDDPFPNIPAPFPDRDSIRKIAVFRALQLGDLLCAIPALRALRHHFPNASVALIGLPGAAGLVSRFSRYIDRLIVFPGYPGLPEQEYCLQEIPVFIRRMQSERFDLMLQMQGNGTLVNPLIELLGARHSAGFSTAGHYTPPGTFIPYPANEHEIRRHLKLTEKLGAPSLGQHLEFPLTNRDEQALADLDLRLKPGQYVCIHPGSRGAHRRWPPVHFARIADLLNREGFRVVLTGTDAELPVVAAVAEHMEHTPCMAAGRTSLGTLGVLIRDAFAIVSNCTGVSHIASALGTPGVIISMDGEPDRWRPLNESVLATIDWNATPSFSLVESAVRRVTGAKGVRARAMSDKYDRLSD